MIKKKFQNFEHFLIFFDFGKN